MQSGAPSLIEGPYFQDILAQPDALRTTVQGLVDKSELRSIGAALRANGENRLVLTGMGASLHALVPPSFGTRDSETSGAAGASSLTSRRTPLRLRDPEKYHAARGPSGSVATSLSGALTDASVPDPRSASHWRHPDSATLVHVSHRNLTRANPRQQRRHRPATTSDAAETPVWAPFPPRMWRRTTTRNLRR